MKAAPTRRATVRARPYKLRCVLFDLDGTLVDTAPDLAYAANRVRESLRLPPLPLARYRPFASAGARGLLHVALDIGPQHEEFPGRRDDFLAHYRANLTRKSRLFDGIESVLAALEKKGLLWGVVTNKPQWLTDPLLEGLKLADRAAVVVGARDGLKPKPAPDSLLHACELLELEPRNCLYVGDDQRDITAARAARMPSAAAAWGYVQPDQRVKDWGADSIFKVPRDLHRLTRGAG